MYTPAIVEFLGTTLLVATFAFTGSPILVVASLAIALGFGGKISGGHFNPALTGWALASGKIGMQKAISYLIAQFGAALFVFMLSSVISV
jgi:glycerol uptake facilitator-like aquaporin